MLEMRNLLKKKLNKKGFTLAELLVVVAIIAVLVAVSIPIFSGKLDDAKKNTDLANERAAKAAAVTAYLSDDITVSSGTATVYYDAKNGVIKDAKAGIAGYSQTTANGGKDANIVKVVITETTDANGDITPKVEVSWEVKA